MHPILALPAGSVRTKVRLARRRTPIWGTWERLSYFGGPVEPQNICA